MANQLTGDFDAVVQIAARQINGLLATLHQTGASENAPLQLPHSVRLRVGDVRRPRPDVGSFGDWVIGFQKVRKPVEAADLRAQLIGTAPPGAAARIHDAFTALDESAVFEQQPTVIRGTADVQVSLVTVSIPDGATSEVTIHAHVRAHYRPDPNTTDLPAPIHGEVRATLDVHKTQSGSGRRLVIRPCADDNKIQFIPASGSGLDPVEASRISVELRKVLRSELTLLPVDLPSEFPFDEFKGVGSGDSHAIALPVQLSGTTAPAGAIQTITQSLVGPSGFAFAVRKDFVDSLIDLEAIREAIKRRRIRIRVSGVVGSVTVTYKLRFSYGPTLIFRAGVIDISGRIEVETDHPLAPNGFVEFKQAVTLILDHTTQTVTLERIGDPEVDESWFIPHGRAVEAVTSELNTALSSSAAPVRNVFSDARSNLRRGLKTFDQSASPFYASLEITPDGIIVRGDIGTASRPGPVVDIRETRDGASFTALHSWIPAGHIERLIWSWVEYPVALPTVWGGVSKSLVEEHRFLLPKPAGITTRSDICLRIEGSLFSSGGHPISVAGGTTCSAADPGTLLEVPAWFEPVTVPLWRPDVADHARVRGALAAHVTVQSITATPQELTHNTLVYFADWRSETPLKDLGSALGRLQRRHIPLAIIVVVPAGAFDERRKELEAKLVPIGEPLTTELHVTEDDEGGWTRTFAPERVPATFLINARRQFVWRHDGTPDATDLAAAFDRFALPAPPPLRRPLRLTVSPGDIAHDIRFEDERGQEFALHRLRGRRALLNFWHSWSTPCLTELRRLQSLYERAQREGTFIVGFHSGKKNGLEKVRRELGVSFPLVQDSEQRIATTYGVRCRPTTIIVDVEGRVEHIQFGLTHAHEHPDSTVQGAGYDG